MKIDVSQYNYEVIGGSCLCSVINSYGYEAYLVGGCVRDIIMYTLGMVDNANIHDVDIATNMPIEMLKAKFKTASNNGEVHGTILVKWNDIYFETTQFRTDGAYTDGRHPDSITFTESFKEDTARRDFTINAMGIDANGNVIDYHNGIKCLEDKVLSTVGDPAERFEEDALRIIRAYRFASRFKMTIPNDVREAIRKTKYKLANIAMERVFDEIKKCMSYGYSELYEMIDHMVTDGIFQIIDPKGYINAVKARNLIGGRAIRKNNNMGEFFTDLGSLVCMLWESDLRNAYQHYKMENETFKCAQWCINHLDKFQDFGHDIVAEVDMVNNKFFNQLQELADAVTGFRVKEDLLDRIIKVAKISAPFNHVLSEAVAECGYQGPKFGRMLTEVRRWHYLNIFSSLVIAHEYKYGTESELKADAIGYIKHIAE